MSALTEVIPSVISYLLTQAAGNASLGAATPPVVIIDGQPVNQDVLVTSGTGLDQRLYIGSEGYAGPGGQAQGASSNQKFSFLDAARTRDDNAEIQCAAEAVSGDSVMAEARAGAFAVMRAVELMLRGSPGTVPASPGDASMGGLVYWSEVTGPVELHQDQQTAGAVALVKFKVTAFTRLTS